MEIKGKEKTLAGLFLKYVVLFCINTILLVGGMLLLLLFLTDLGLMLPANYAELQLANNEENIRKAGNSLETWIPDGCTYGLYNRDGVWLNGSFSQEEQQDAWEQYNKHNLFASNKEYYRFIHMDDGNVCIVKYRLLMRYSIDKWNSVLPAPEVLMPILDFLLFILNILLVSKSFAKKIKVQLGKLSTITEKIAGNDLEFQVTASEIKEINEVMISLGQMKDALLDSLKVQWDMERQKQEQLAALAHDIKTPLTIIRGNTELLEEADLSEENMECAEYILTNVKEIEHYLEAMRQVLRSKEQMREGEQEMMDVSALAEQFLEAAKQLSLAEKLPVAFDIEPSVGKVRCSKEQILRAWNNIVSNGAEYTDRKNGLDISIREIQKGNQPYLAARVRDYGTGFSQRDLQNADKEFYSGDVSRHDRKHQGLGLSIAKRFVEEQGGFLEYKNSRTGTGAEVTLWLKME